MEIIQTHANTDFDGLAAMLAALRQAGCHNWNLVSPTPWLPWIAAAVAAARAGGPSLPVVYNTSGFEARATLGKAAEDISDWCGYLDELVPASSGEGTEAA